MLHAINAITNPNFVSYTKETASGTRNETEPFFSTSCPKEQPTSCPKEQPTSSSIKLKIDMREHALMDKLRLKSFPFESANLPLGDILIEENGIEMVIIERKTIDDLLASIKDGRYDEQAMRLSSYSNVHNHNIIYLLEGTIKSYQKPETVYSSMFSVLYYKGFSCLRSVSLDETVSLICQIVKKMEKELGKRNPFYQVGIARPNEGNTHPNGIHEGNVAIEINAQNVAPSASCMSYTDTIKKIKRDNITPQNILEIMLIQIPNVSPASAKLVTQRYSSMSALLNALASNPQCLADLAFVDEATGKSRKVSKTTLANIVTYLTTQS